MESIQDAHSGVLPGPSSSKDLSKAPDKVAQSMPYGRSPQLIANTVVNDACGADASYPSDDTRVIDVTCNTVNPNTAVMNGIRSEVQRCLPFPWIAMREDKGINVLLLSRTQHRLVQRRAFFSYFGDEVFTVHCKPIVGETLEKLLQGISVQTHKVGVKDGHVLVERIINVVKRLQSYEVCVGVDDNIYKPLWKLEAMGEVDKNPYGELRYKETFRPLTCHLLVDTEKILKRRCTSCIQTKIKFKSKLTTLRRDKVEPSTPNVHLDRNHLLLKLKTQQHKLRYSRSKIMKLKAELQKATKSKGLHIDSELYDIVLNICMACYW